MNRDKIESFYRATNGSCDAFRIAGSHNSSIRQAVYSAMIGRKTTKAESGITNIEREAFEIARQINPAGMEAASCLAIRRDVMRNAFRAVMGE